MGKRLFRIRVEVSTWPCFALMLRASASCLSPIVHHDPPSPRPPLVEGALGAPIKHGAAFFPGKTVLRGGHPCVCGQARVGDGENVQEGRQNHDNKQKHPREKIRRKQKHRGKKQKQGLSLGSEGRALIRIAFEFTGSRQTSIRYTAGKERRERLPTTRVWKSRLVRGKTPTRAELTIIQPERGKGNTHGRTTPTRLSSRA